MKISHFLGGVLLVSGTTIGVGMLGLPVSTGFIGFFPSLLLFAVCWLFMLFSGIYFVDVNLSMKGGVNLITMADRTLGTWGRMVSWFIYLLLLYSLMAAYIASSAPLFSAAFLYIFGAELPVEVAKFALPLLFGGFIYLGTEGVDLINRVLMIGLVIAYLLLIVLIPEHMQMKLLTHISWSPFAYAAPIVITSFGYHIIIPTLTTYLSKDRKKLYAMVIIGSFISLLVNVVWQFLVLSTVPLSGSSGLAAAWVDGVAATRPLSVMIQTPILSTGIYFFSLFAILTSFLGVSLSLADFLVDGLRLKKGWEGRLIAILLTFIPPLIFVYSYERGFFLALEYAGAFVAILLVFIPSLMAWKLKTPKFYTTLSGKILLMSTILFAVGIVTINILIRWNVFEPILMRAAR